VFGLIHEAADHIAQDVEPLVDVDALLGLHTSGSSLFESFTPGKVYKVELAAEILLDLVDSG